MLEPSKSKRYFTKEIGATTNRFMSGPLVITYIHHDAEIAVKVGHPANEDGPIIAELTGADFKGHFFVQYDWAITGSSQKALVSGFFPYPDTPMDKTRYTLECGADLFYNFGNQSTLILHTRHKDSEAVEKLKRDAIRQAESLMGCQIEYDKWEPVPGEKEGVIALYFELDMPVL